MEKLLNLVQTDITNIPIYVINAKGQKDRLENTLEQLKKLSMKNINIIEAIEPDFAKQHMHNFFSYKAYKNINNPQNTNYIPTWSAAACAISHIDAWLKILESEKNIAIVCEDDIKIKDENILKFFMIEAYLGAQKTKNSIWFFNAKNKKIYPNYNYNNYNNGHYSSAFVYQSDPKCFKKINNEYYYDCLVHSHFYLVTKSALSEMKNNFFPIEYQIDIHISKILRERCNLIVMNTNFDCNVDQDNEKFPSTVQYFNFKNSNDLWNCIDKKIPVENCQIIHDFMNIKISYDF
jgi:hypothetical protein